MDAYVLYVLSEVLYEKSTFLVELFANSCEFCCEKGFSKEKTTMPANESTIVENRHGKFQSRRQRKIALQQDVSLLF